MLMPSEAFYHFFFHFRDLQKALQDCKTLYPLLELSRSSCNTGAHLVFEVSISLNTNLLIIVERVSLN